MTHWNDQYLAGYEAGRRRARSEVCWGWLTIGIILGALAVFACALAWRGGGA